MDGFEVSPDALAAAGEATGRVAAAVRAVDVGGAVTALAAALPGGTVAGRAATIAAGWTAAVGGLADQLGVHGERLGTAATNYRNADTALTGAIHGALTGAR